MGESRICILGRTGYSYYMNIAVGNILLEEMKFVPRRKITSKPKPKIQIFS